MLPEVERYFNAVDAAEQATLDKLSKLDGSYNSLADREDFDLYWAKRHELRATLVGEKKLLWEELGNSSDKLVRFIGTNCWDYHNSASKVLRELPTSFERLQSIAAEEDWCETFDHFVEQAIAEGVIEAPNVSVLRTRLVMLLMREHGLSRHETYKVMSLIGKIIAAEREANTQKAE